MVGWIVLSVFLSLVVVALLYVTVSLVAALEQARDLKESYFGQLVIACQERDYFRALVQRVAEGDAEEWVDAEPVPG